MRDLADNLSRRRFLGSTTLLGIASTLLFQKTADTFRRRTKPKNSLDINNVPWRQRALPQC